MQCGPSHLRVTFAAIRTHFLRENDLHALDFIIFGAANGQKAPVEPAVEAIESDRIDLTPGLDETARLAMRVCEP